MLQARCPYCGTTHVKKSGYAREIIGREIRKGRTVVHWRKLYDYYTCSLCGRRFSRPESDRCYMTSEEKTEFIKILRSFGMKDVAEKVEARQLLIHKKSQLGKLYNDLKQNVKSITRGD